MAKTPHLDGKHVVFGKVPAAVEALLRVVSLPLIIIGNKNEQGAH